EHVAVVERRVPVRGAPRGRDRDPRPARSRARQAREGVAEEATRVRARREERPHASHGRDARHARAGVRRGRPARRRRTRAASPAAMRRLCALPVGGPAVGRGTTAPKPSARRVIAKLAERTGLPLTEARDHFAAQGARDALVETSGQLRALAVALVKIANDLRWMASGPSTGLGEIRLPDLQPGSSIMPGKVNPVIPEVVTQVAAQVMGNDATVAFGGSQGNFELNVFVPVIARNLLESIDLLANVCGLFADRCIAGIAANPETLARYAEASPAVATALNPYLGYETVAEIVKEAS